MKWNRREIGTKYEEKAVALLEEQGYLILERNYRNHFGEIDIIAQQDAVLVFVEVKYRKNNRYGDPLAAVDWQKQRRICRSALYYCMKQKGQIDIPCRFDVITIDGDQNIRHMENAFEYQES